MAFKLLTIPDEILAAAAKVDEFFTSSNRDDWELCGCASRVTLQKLRDQYDTLADAEAMFRARVSELEAKLSSLIYERDYLQGIVNSLTESIANTSVIDPVMVQEAWAHLPYDEPRRFIWLADRLNHYLRHGVPDPFHEDEPRPEWEGFSEETWIATGTKCSICYLMQYNTQSGVTCPNGHGGAPAATEEPPAPKPVLNTGLDPAPSLVDPKATTRGGS